MHIHEFMSAAINKIVEYIKANDISCVDPNIS